MGEEVAWFIPDEMKLSEDCPHSASFLKEVCKKEVPE